MQPVVITTTVENKEQAYKLSRQLVENKYVACANVVGPIMSFFPWEGKQEEDEEYKLFLKTWAEQWDALLEFCRREHPYDVPEFTMLEANKMQPEYQKWMGEVIESK